jgi:hypothetical protein
LECHLPLNHPVCRKLLDGPGRYGLVDCVILGWNSFLHQHACRGVLSSLARHSSLHVTQSCTITLQKNLNGLMTTDLQKRIFSPIFCAEDEESFDIKEKNQNFVEIICFWMMTFTYLVAINANTRQNVNLSQRRSTFNLRQSFDCATSS